MGKKSGSNAISPSLISRRAWEGLVISPMGKRQSVPVYCVQPVSYLSAFSSGGLVGVCLEAYTNQWDRIMSNVFVINVVRNGYALEFAEGKFPPLSRAPLAFNSAGVGSDQAPLNEALLKLLEKGGD